MATETVEKRFGRAALLWAAAAIVGVLVILANWGWRPAVETVLVALLAFLSGMCASVYAGPPEGQHRGD